MSKKFIQDRRDFLKKTALAAVAIPALSLSKFSPLTAEAAPKAAALPAGATAVSESDPVATAIGFKHNVKDIDKKKYPNRKPDQFCKNCALFTKTNDGWGKCSMLTSGLVSADGWCGSWSKKS